MGHFGFLVVLLISFSLCEPQWSAYTDRMTALCANVKGAELLTQKQLLASCFTVQQNYLHCVFV